MGRLGYYSKLSFQAPKEVIPKKFCTGENSSFVSSHLKLFKDRLLLKIRFNTLTSKLLYSCCTLEWSMKNWPNDLKLSITASQNAVKSKAKGTD